MESVMKQSNNDKEWINSLNDKFYEIEERTDAYTEKKIKENESEGKSEGEQRYIEKLKIHKKQAGTNLIDHIGKTENLIHQTTDKKSDICKVISC